MRGLDLNVFDFDYDLTWFALFLNADGHVYGRFGGRDADTPGKYHSLAGLKHALSQALARHQLPLMASQKRVPQRIDEYPAAQRFARNACFHCHHVYEFRHADMQAKSVWKTADVWVYPETQTLGFELDLERGDRLSAVKPGSPAAKADLKTGDLLQILGSLPVASHADAQYALHRAGAVRRLSLSYQRAGKTNHATLDLPENWRHTDVSWRQSLKSLKPDPAVRGSDLSVAEKKALGLTPAALAFQQGPFPHPAVRQAGILINDVILGIEGQSFQMTARQFQAHVRLNYQPGATLRLIVLRGKEKFTLPLKLPVD